MLTWLLKTIGVGDDLIMHLDRATLAVQRETVLWVGLALLVPIGFYIHRRQRQNLTSAPPALRIALCATRITILALLVGVLAGPYLKLDEQVEKRPIVAMVFDQSRSMRLPAGPFESDEEVARIAQAAGYPALNADARKALNQIARVKLAQDVVRADPKALTEPLARKYDLRYYAFAKGMATIGVDPAHPEFPEPPESGSSATQIGDAVAQVLDEAAGRQVAGVLLFTDGQNTGGRSPAEAARAAANIGAPIFTVPVGSAARLHDLAIVDVFTSGLVSLGDTARVAVTLESQGFDQRPVKVELRDGETLLDSKEIVLRGAEQQQVELAFQAKEPGAKYLTVKIPPLPEEPEHLRSNNEDIAFVRVSEEKVRVLYVGGLPQWDFRFLKNAMRRDNGLGGRTSKEPDIVLESEWRRRPEDQRAAALPATIETLAEYHTIILGDASPSLISPAFVKLLGEAVRDRGVGLVVAAGPRAMPHAFDERLRELLPVQMRRKASGLEAPVYKPFRLELSPDGVIHEVMRLSDDVGRNQNTWGRMPPYFWCAAVERPSPAATVLAWNPSVEGRFGKLPLIAYQYAGRGKVMFVGTDSTWLWRQNVGDRFFYKFWGQTIRFVARRDDKDARKSRIEVRPLRAQPGEQAEIELLAMAPDGSPRNDPTLPVRVTGGGAPSTVEVAADPATRGRFTGKFPLPTAGDYVVAYDPGGGLKPVEAKVRVTVAPEELRHPNVNRPALEIMAGASGGELVELPDLGKVPGRIKGESKQIPRHSEASLWDNWLTLTLLVAVYSLDVGLRRLAGLS